MKDIYIIYAIVFAAVCLPIALWRREQAVDIDLPQGDWRRVPPIFKLLWRPMFMLETSLGAALARLLPRSASNLVEKIEIANLPLTAKRVLVAKAVLLIVLGGLGAVVYLFPNFPYPGIRPFHALAFAVVGWTLPTLAVASAAQSRQQEIIKALPFAIDLIGSAMRAGLEFGAAMRYYAGLGGGGALEEEFSRVARDATLGKPIAESLQDMAARVRIKTFTAFAGVIAYGTEIGASIADTLKIHGAEMRRERFSIAEQKAARAPSVMIFPLAVFILPAVFLIIFVPVLMQFIATKGG